ncbi:hypothetical protein N0B31_09900 [Salinirubellus salinus]|jgi:hypothetical protein|uniref:Uncharacterized protein n=1 Tax=Salinirubellus salinus TaxID=1364945 RepID=A0A9E7R8Q2_9EURY|nr:hypothetical protein [Salinirubellus salinus]UWM56588.1 hypothetical protein N0B31_09900 [Salinirubellus salinus]
MPIGPDEWETGRTAAADDSGSAVKDRLHEFLELNRGKAYTADELAKVYAREIAGDAIAGEDPAKNQLDAPDHTTFQRFLGRLSETVFRRSGTVDAALRELEAEGAIESKVVETSDGTRTYYRVRDAE